MTGNNPHLLELRRRVQADPASIAFAQLAEECRRNGNNDEAVGICRAGLGYHPDYLSARITLGRALVALGRLDEAHTELGLVLTVAPDNLAANRAIAEMYQLRGQLSEALVHYKRALDLAQNDPDLEHQVERIESVVSSLAPTEPNGEPAPVVIGDLFDLDTLLEQLGGGAPSTTESASSSMAAPALPTSSPLDAVELVEDDSDLFARLERQLRDSEAQRGYDQVAASMPDEGAIDQCVLAELEDWLAAIALDRQQPHSGR